MPKHRPSIKVLAVDFVVYNSNNMKRSKNFYTEIFGPKRGREYASFGPSSPILTATASASTNARTVRRGRHAGR